MKNSAAHNAGQRSELYALAGDYRSGSHRVAGVVACLASVVLHVWLLYVLLTLPFNLLRSGTDIQEREFFKGMEVEVKQPESAREAPVDRSEGVGQPSLDAEVDPNELTTIDDALKPSTPEEVLAPDGSLAGPGRLPEAEEWNPRQEIVEIREKIVKEEVSTLPRRVVPDVERVQDAPDFLPPVDRQDVDMAMGEEDRPGPVQGGFVDTGGPAAAPPGEDGAARGQSAGDLTEKKFGEHAEEVSELKPIEELLEADVTVLEGAGDSDMGYFVMEIERAGAEKLPVIPKDVVLVQDCSASMTDRRLGFCKKGLAEALELIGEDDRFNVVAFRNDTKRCFAGWAGATPSNFDRARGFIKSLHSSGNTDLYSSLKALTGIGTSPERPSVSIVVSDGLPTSGMTDSTDIIGKFSKDNDGRMSVFTVGTLRRGNTYLLDMLSYCNKGDSYVISRGKWEIPDAIELIMQQVSRPVMADLAFRFPEGSNCEVYPLLASDLYLDRPLVLYGRYRKGSPRVVFQAVGKGRNVKCDMIFDIDLSSAGRSEDTDIRVRWAQQKIYHLLGQYARRQDPAIIRRLHQTAEEYGLRVPYRDRIR